jgi:Secretion system C-terminal sorting domain
MFLCGKSGMNKTIKNKKMKKLFCIAIFLGSIFSLLSISAFAQTCPQISFSYDASGNRVQRKWALVACKMQRSRSDSTESPRPLVANVYPNPTQDKLNIELQKEEAGAEQSSTILLYDLSGKEVYSTVTTSLQVQVDVSGLGAGNYLLKIIRGKEYTTYTISKN